ncbi:SGNH/GDSL hydrolase family protein [Intrasporangium calvum]|uniref:SGNH/GDSL hydrolase family protein n=1 Tax=Intrasporangium calvum TaxID=53358 RepID=UPI0012370A91|nr:SGNH/GDSL hydrolase family protein [Intrasporangium calvum]
MRRSRATDVSLGLIALLINVAIVVAVVFFIGGDDAPPAASTSPTTTATPGSSSSAGTGGALPEVSQLLASDADLVLAVLGDGTGDEDGEWVSVLADLAGSTRQVTLRNLDPTDPTRYADEQTYGTSGPTTVIWNGSRPGAGAGYAADRLDFLIPEEPDAVVLNYGRDDKASAIANRLDTTLSAVRAKWPKVPVVVVLQAPNLNDQLAPVRKATEKWAAAKKLPTVDVAAAFRQAGDPNSFVSVVDPPSVNAQGGLLWGETVYRAIGGRIPEDPSSPPTVGAEATDVIAPGAAFPVGDRSPVGAQPTPTAVSTTPPAPEPTPTETPVETSTTTFKPTRATQNTTTTTTEPETPPPAPAD